MCVYSGSGRSVWPYTLVALLMITGLAIHDAVSSLEQGLPASGMESAGLDLDTGRPASPNR